MICDCIITKEDIERGIPGCTEDCLNRLLMMEWYADSFEALSPVTYRPSGERMRFNNHCFCFLSGSRCPTGEYCTNRRFQKVASHRVNRSVAILSKVH